MDRELHLVMQVSGNRWLMPADNDLINALGRAIYNFAQLELSVDHVRRKLCGVVGTLSVEGVAVALERDADALPWDGELVARLLRVMRRYQELKPRRDRLLCLPQHGPGAWCVTDILALAHQFEVAGIEANQVLRRYL